MAARLWRVQWRPNRVGSYLSELLNEAATRKKPFIVCNPRLASNPGAFTMYTFEQKRFDEQCRKHLRALKLQVISDKTIMPTPALCGELRPSSIAVRIGWSRRISASNLGAPIHHSHHPTTFSAFCHSPGALSTLEAPVASSIGIDINQGECVCIHLALSHPDSMLLMDERSGRVVTRQHSIAVAGNAARNGQAPMRNTISSALDAKARDTHIP